MNVRIDHEVSSHVGLYPPLTSGSPVLLLQRHPVGPDLPDLLKRLYLEPARKKAAAMYQTRNPEFKEKQIHQKVEVTQN